MSRLGPYWKAFLGFVAPAASVVGTAILPDSDGGSAITGPEWVAAAVAAVITGAAVYAKANHPTAAVPDGDGDHRAG